MSGVWDAGTKMEKSIYTIALIKPIIDPIKQMVDNEVFKTTQLRR